MTIEKLIHEHVENNSKVTAYDRLARSAVADLINHWQRVIHKKAFELNKVTELEAYQKLGYYEGMFDQICTEKGQ